jgi:hypothetical protein
MSDALKNWLEGGGGQQTSDVRAEQIRQLSNFFIIDENLAMKTELDKKTIERMSSGEVVDDFCKQEWDIDLGYRKENVSEMAKLVSHKRRGREEAMSVLKQHVELVDERSTASKVLLG